MFYCSPIPLAYLCALPPAMEALFLIMLRSDGFYEIISTLFLIATDLFLDTSLLPTGLNALAFSPSYLFFTAFFRSFRPQVLSQCTVTTKAYVIAFSFILPDITIHRAKLSPQKEMSSVKSNRLWILSLSTFKSIILKVIKMTLLSSQPCLSRHKPIVLLMTWPPVGCMSAPLLLSVPCFLQLSVS